MVRAKFKVESIQRAQGQDGGSVTLRPVVGGSAENERFYRYTPGGQILLSTVNEDALAQFDVGAEMYVDFTVVPAEVTPGA